MTKNRLKGKMPKGAKVWSTPNMAIYRQLGFWYDPKVCYQFVPCTAYGFVIVTERNVTPGNDPLEAWVCFRPMSISLAWEINRNVQLATLPMDSAIAWYNDYDRAWEHIKAQRGTAL
jgi:hypothetical protein